MADEVDEVMRRQRVAVRGALERIGDDLQGEASRRAPIREGTLRASGRVELIEHGDSIEAWVIFATPYAAVQHEREDFAHPLGGEAKYLERPLKASLHRYQGIVAAAIRRAL